VSCVPSLASASSSIDILDHSSDTLDQAQRSDTSPAPRSFGKRETACHDPTLLWQFLGAAPCESMQASDRSCCRE
jgi:hypothetical protein